MLTKRTTVLFEEETWQILCKLAQQERVSVGTLIREAVKYHYVRPVKRHRIQRLAQLENYREKKK